MAYKASRAREYGIGRVPQDVDAAEEALAGLEAERIIEAQIGPRQLARAGDYICPAGTTQGIRTPGARCHCGRDGNWNPGAGETLCARHWDEY